MGINNKYEIFGVSSWEDSGTIYRTKNDVKKNRFQKENLVL